MAKSDRKIALEEGVVVGDTKYMPGDEAALASAGVPEWNLKQMADKAWITGDWSGKGITPEEEAAQAEEIAAAAAPAARKRAR